MIHLTDCFQQINRIDLAEQTGLLYWSLAYTTPGFFFRENLKQVASL